MCPEAWDVDWGVGEMGLMGGVLRVNILSG